MSMHKAARMIGLVWMSAVVAAGFTLLIADTMALARPVSGRGLVYIAFAALLPGTLLYRWGRNAEKYLPHTRALFKKTYPQQIERQLEQPLPAAGLAGADSQNAANDSGMRK